MMKKKEIQQWLDDNIESMISLEQQGQDRDWEAYDEIRLENDVLRAILK